jgi:hypothetical protein
MSNTTGKRWEMGHTYRDRDVGHEINGGDDGVKLTPLGRSRTSREGQSQNSKVK